eukprot:11160954-Lingulodinium_polyedra.AAC.1
MAAPSRCRGEGPHAGGALGPRPGHAADRGPRPHGHDDQCALRGRSAGGSTGGSAPPAPEAHHPGHTRQGARHGALRHRGCAACQAVAAEVALGHRGRLLAGPRVQP